ncbi:glutamine amidotransferase [Scrofimicrobium sp. R131]|uniref:Lipid II isoglutaminyl synthase (glutamine-hydrolyzing) subunit GatD n=1 Tax=Scrofimicrobium appendicitidis TaxID=3079930 RepID=A0AAU7V9B4_9ACTO
MSESTVRIGVLAPEVLGTYGDSGNALILAERARRRGFPAEIVTVNLSEPIPDQLDLYSLGGGEDTAQALAADHLRSERGLSRAVAAGRPVLAICASLQILGRIYVDAAGNEISGLGLLDLETHPRGERAIGEVVTRPLLPELTQLLTGFENHGGGTRLGPDARPLGEVLAGTGNGFDRVEGAVQGSIIATYLHGPVLARNPELADLLLSQALGQDLAPLELPAIDQLRQERLSDAGVDPAVN